MMVDSLAYHSSGEVIMTNLSKGHALPTLGAAISAIGPAALSRHLADKVAYAFSSFDDLVRDGEQFLSCQFDDFASERRSGDASSTIYLIGWHAAENKPGAYAMDVWSDDSSRITQVAENTGFSSEAMNAIRNKLIPQPTNQISGSPLPGQDLIDEAGFRLQSHNDRHNPEVDLLHLMEIARHERIEDAHWVGGKAVLTSISKDGITEDRRALVGRSGRRVRDTAADRLEGLARGSHGGGGRHQF